MRSSCIVGNVGSSWIFKFFTDFSFPVCHLWFWWCNWSVLKSNSLEHLFTAPNTYLSAELSRFRIYCRLFSHFSKRIQSSIDGSTSTYNVTHSSKWSTLRNVFLYWYFLQFVFFLFLSRSSVTLTTSSPECSPLKWSSRLVTETNFPLPATLLKNIHLFSINSRCFCVFNVFTLPVCVWACGRVRPPDDRPGPHPSRRLLFPRHVEHPGTSSWWWGLWLPLLWRESLYGAACRWVMTDLTAANHFFRVYSIVINNLPSKALFAASTKKRNESNVLHCQSWAAQKNRKRGRLACSWTASNSDWNKRKTWISV